MKIKYLIILFAAGAFISCSQKEKSTTQEELGTAEQEIKIDGSSYQKLINTVESKLDLLKNSKELQTLEIQSLTAKRDSLSDLLNQIEGSLSDINTKKLKPGIEGVNEKLNELKGQKENFEEQLKLQKKEIELAGKKITLLNEEKSVYDAQKQALWDKGAPPEDFVEIDTLLNNLTKRISEQKTKVKNLNRNINDREEQIVSIIEQRSSLSNKIRNNYTAKQIFEDYSKEEKGKLIAEINKIDEIFKAYLDKDSELSNELAKIAAEKSNLEAEQTGLLKQKEQNEAQLQQQKSKEKEAKKRSRLSYAFIGIGFLAMLMIVFYFVGKRKRNKIK